MLVAAQSCNVLTQFLDGPIEVAVRKRLEAYGRWASSKDLNKPGWRRDDASLAKPLEGPTPKGLTVGDLAHGMRKRPIFVTLHSSVSAGQALFCGQPLPNFVSAEYDYSSIENLPTAICHRRPRHEDRKGFMAECYNAAVDEDAFHSIRECLKRARDRADFKARSTMRILEQALGNIQEIEDPWTAAKVIIAVLPWATAAITRMRHGHQIPMLPLGAPTDPSTFYVDTLGTKMVTDPELAIQFVNMFDILFFSHGSNMSETVATILAMGRGSLMDCVQAGLLALNTPLHGGAQPLIAPMLEDLISYCQLSEGEFPSDKQLINWCKVRLGAGKNLDGFGHPVYRNAHDGRATAFREFGLATPTIAANWTFQLLGVLREKLPTILKRAEIQSIRAIEDTYTNVDFEAAPMQRLVLGITDPDCNILGFARSRGVAYAAASLEVSAMKLPIFRAQSFDLQMMEDLTGKSVADYTD